jgi:N-acetyl-gamma-glutamylphosphate reductase
MIEDYEAEGPAASHYMPYGLTFKHKHLPEMQVYARLNRAPLFEPVVGNFAQGMTTSLPLHLDMVADIPSGKDIHAALADFYAAIPQSFVRVAPTIPTSPRPRPSPLSNRVCRQAPLWFQGLSLARTAFAVVMSFRMAATMASLPGLPWARRR